MHWFTIVSILVLLVATVWAVSQKSPSAQAQGRLATLAARVGGTAKGLAIQLEYRGLPAEGAVIEGRDWEREGRVSRIAKRYIWKVRLVTENGSRTDYYPMASAEDVPEPEQFLAQLARVAEERGQG